MSGHTAFTPMQHQLDAQPVMSSMELRGGGFLCDSCGMGKTPTMAMFLVSNKISKRPSLIVCPFSVISTWETWIDRANGWDGAKYPKPRILVYHGPKRRQHEKKLQTYDFVITTYAIIGTGELNNKKWGRTVLDESHMIKNGLQRNAPKCAKAAFEIGTRSLKRWCISATPFNNRMKDVAAQAMFVGAKPYDLPSWWKENGEIPQQLDSWRSDCMIRRTKDDMLAPPQYHDIHVDPTRNEERIVEMLRGRAQEDFEAWKKAKRERNNLERIRLQGKILGLIQKLRIVSDSYYSGEGAVEANEVMRRNAKVRRMIDDLDRAVDRDPNRGVVVFSQFTSFLDTFEQVIEEVLPGIGIMKFYGDMNQQQRNEVVDRFNNSREPRIILVSLMAGGVGLSLHHGSSTAFLAEPYYNPFAEQQAEERVHRIGQAHQVNIYRYHMNNSVESWIDGLKQKKLVIAGDLNLVNGESIPVDFNFDDIAELFQTHVAFTDDKDDKKKKSPDPEPKILPSTRNRPRQGGWKKHVRRKGPPLKKPVGKIS